MTTARECSWEAASDSDWVSLTSGASGSGDGTVTFSVRPNPTASPRTGSLVVNDQQVRVAVEPAPCRFQLDRSSYSAPAPGGSAAVILSAPSGCGWSASAGVDWVKVDSPSGNGSGAVRFTVSANTGAARRATLSIAGLPFAVEQQGRVASPPPGPPPPGSVEVRIEGELKKVTGPCPTLTLEIEGPVDLVNAQARTTVTTNGSTVFAGAACSSLKNKDKVRVLGAMGSDGRVAATRVEFLQR